MQSPAVSSLLLKQSHILRYKLERPITFQGILNNTSSGPQHAPPHGCRALQRRAHQFVGLVLQDELGDFSYSRYPEVIDGHVSSYVEQLVSVKKVYQSEIEEMAAIDEDEVEPLILVRPGKAGLMGKEVALTL